MDPRPVPSSLSADSVRIIETDAYAAARDIRLTIFVACYNEEQNIIPSLERLTGALAELDFTSDVIVIDDGSTDDSVNVVTAYMKTHQHLPIRLAVSPVNRGLAYNYVEGAFMGRGEYYRLICGDAVEPKETFHKIMSLMGSADIILAYPVWTKNRPFSRRFLSRTFTGLVNLISGYRIHYYNGLPLCRRQHVMRWHSYSRGFGFQADQVVRMLDHGASYREVGVVFSERPDGAPSPSALKLNNILSVFHTLLQLVIRRVSRDYYNARRRRMLARQQAAQGQPVPPEPAGTGTGAGHPGSDR